MAAGNQVASEKVYQSLDSFGDVSKSPKPEQAEPEGADRAAVLEGSKSHYLETSDYSVHKQQLHERLGRLGKGHARALSMAGYIGGLDKNHHVQSDKIAGKLASCGAWLVFREWLRSGTIKLKGGMFCQQHTLCPLCAQLRAGKMVGKYAEQFEKVAASYTLTRATFTVKDGPNLVERLKHLQKAFGLLMAKARRARSGGRNKTEFSKFVGGVISYEVKRGKNSGLWHPHGHSINLQDGKIDIEALRDEWQQATGDSRNLELRVVHGDKIGAFCEVFKYAMKFSDMTLKDNWEASRSLARKKLLRSWGILRGVKPSDDLTDEGEESGPYINRFFRYSTASQNYRCQSIEHCKGDNHEQAK
jgi:hypothetical protein